MCSVDRDGDDARVWNETPRRAAKLHYCAGCETPIHSGEAYLDHRSFAESWWAEAACFGCWWAREMFAEAHERRLFVFAELIDRLRECIVQSIAEADEWRPVLAALMWRYRRSPSWVRHIHRRTMA